jgi:alkylated DNA repair dioxygenase AlkB
MVMNPTLELFDDPRTSALPPGLTYRPNFIEPADEAALLLHLRQLDFAPYEFRGVSARRRVIAFGYQHDYKTRRLGEAPALPSFLETLREQVAAWLNCEPTDFRQALVSEYRPGTPIGWH